MHVANYATTAALLMVSAASVMAQPTRPTQTPLVTVADDTKLLVFNWRPVPRATYYQFRQPEQHG